MIQLFEVVFLNEAYEFLKSLDRKHYEKIIYNIRKVQNEHDPKLFKKLTDDIWEFRTLYQGLQYRLLAFWDKSSPQETLVIATHGFVKKKSKISEKEINKAAQMKEQYFENKSFFTENNNKKMK